MICCFCNTSCCGSEYVILRPVVRRFLHHVFYIFQLRICRMNYKKAAALLGRTAVVILFLIVLAQANCF